MPGFIYLIAPGFYEDESKLELTILLTRITFPFLLFISLASFFSAILNSHNKFGVAAASPIILNIILIIIIFQKKIFQENNNFQKKMQQQIINFSKKNVETQLF